MIDEGYIKYKSFWTKAPVPAAAAAAMGMG